MVEPPSLIGSLNDISIYESPGSAETNLGPLGVPAMADTVDDDDPIPYVFLAAT